MKRLAGLVLAVAVIAGMKFYNKASAHDDVRARLVELCAGDAQCQSAVQTHYDGCFDSAYGGRGSRAASRLDASALVACVNKRSGEEYFTVDEKKK